MLLRAAQSMGLLGSEAEAEKKVAPRKKRHVSRNGYSSR
jgi:hypothetical protein